MADIISVSALNRYVKSLLESDAVLTDIAIRGEVQNFVNHYKSGHFYFSLKDEKGSVRAVMFKSYASRLSFVPENGMSVVVRGRITLYERDGSFQIYVETLFPDGVGAAQIAFEQLKARLSQEGLFAPETKKPLPAFPKRIGLVTSKTGAAIKDIYSVAQRRWPLSKFVLYDATVQGKEAETTLVEGVRRLDAEGDVDVIIVARGGGSREDLWVFNSEALARCVWACQTPVVSGVGHEIDFTILDFVADLRAATPTAAAEIVLPDVESVKKQVYHQQIKAAQIVLNKYEMCYNNYTLLCRAAAKYSPERKMKEQTEHLLLLLNTAKREMLQKHTAYSRRLAHSAELIDSLSPLSTLKRGYCIACNAQDTVIRKSDDLASGDLVRLDFSDFSAECTVDRVIPR